MISAPPATHFATIIKSVVDEASRLPSLGKISLKSRKLFAVDLSLVALAVRTGYLVDVVAPRDAIDVFSRLLSGLRKTDSIFETVIHVYEPTSDQSIFVNIPMLMRNNTPGGISPTTRPGIRALQDEGNMFSFVLLHPDQRCELLSAPPADVTSILQSLINELPSASPLPVSKTLPRTLSQDTSVPLAAVLIEFPVAYVPVSSHQVSFLSDTPLDVYEFVLTFDETQRFSNPHTLLKFSCPSTMANEYPDVLGPSRIIERLLATFQPRIQNVLPSTELVVRQSVEIVDRVAL